MADKIVAINLTLDKPIKILKWKVKNGVSISSGRIILLYKIADDASNEQKKFKASKAGTIHKIIAQERDIVAPGETLFELKECSHPTVMKDMCAECGADLRKEEISNIASVAMIHTVPELKVSEKLAQQIGQEDIDRLLKDRKLALLVDLDQTLIHTTNDNIPADIKDVYHFQLYGSRSPWYHTRLRPGTQRFLENMSKLFELHICTFGARNYAHMIAVFLDRDGKYFSQRILSRDECFDPTSKTANLKALFPCGDNMVCIIDDREDVWSYASNLIHVKPYHFFKHTGDINAPPGLEKSEEDEKEGVDLMDIDNFASVHSEKEESENSDASEKTISEKINVAVSPINETDSDKKSIKQLDVEMSESNKIHTNSAPTDDSVKNNTEKSSEPKKLNSNKTDSIPETDEDKIKIENNVEKKNCKKTNEIQRETNEKNTELKTEEECKETKNSDTVVNSADSASKNKDNSIVLNGKNKISDESKAKNEGRLREVPDADNYLFSLEKILTNIHKAFYECYDKMESGNVPDLKTIIPSVHSKVLVGTKLVFSGLVPTHINLEQSRAYQVARSLGAVVTQDFQLDTTHLVAIRPGTAKVNAGRRKKGLLIVTPEWLWTCAECWEKVDEKLFPLSNKPSKNRHPPPHCSSPEHRINFDYKPSPRKRTASGRFMDTINPLMTFSSAEIADMDREVDEDINESESDTESEVKPSAEDILLQELKKASESDRDSSSSDDSLTGEHPKGWRKRSRDKLKDSEAIAESLEDDSTADDYPSAKFRRGEALPSDLDDLGQNSDSDGGSVENPDEVDDGEWNMMGAALEREFLAND